MKTLRLPDYMSEELTDIIQWLVDSKLCTIFTKLDEDWKLVICHIS